MHQIKFWLWLCPDPTGGAYSAPPDPLAGFRGPTSKGKGERNGEGERGKEKGSGRGGRPQILN